MITFRFANSLLYWLHVTYLPKTVMTFLTVGSNKCLLPGQIAKTTSGGSFGKLYLLGFLHKVHGRPQE